MKNFSSYTTTSSGLELSPKASFGFTLPFSQGDYTIGGKPPREYISIGRSTRPTSDAWTTVVNTPNTQLAANAETLLEDIEAAIERLAWTGYDTDTLPRLHAFSPEDDSLVFEWITPKFRVGFSVERNPSDSGWYLVSTPDLGQLGASGQLSGYDPKLIPCLLQFVARNS